MIDTITKKRVRFHRRRSHELAMWFQDRLVHLLKETLARDAFRIKIDIPVGAIPPDEAEPIADWLLSQGMILEYRELARRDCIFALISDFCHFVYESLTAARKYKTTVAYALIRKPLKDNLLYLEWILADKNDFLNAFCSQNPLNLDTTVQTFGENRKKELIDGAVKKTFLGSWLTADYIYDVRYNKKCEFGLEAQWNKAAHLITTCPSYRTAGRNFNFIFSHQADLDYQMDQYYSLLPAILLHAVEVCEALVATLPVKIDDHQITMERIRRAMGFMVWSDKCDDSEQRKQVKPILDFATLPMTTCPSCKNALTWNSRNAMRFFRKNRMRCDQCDLFVLI